MDAELLIYQLGDEEWYIGRSEEEILNYIKAETGFSQEEIDDMEFTPQDQDSLDILKYYDSENDIEMTFKEAIKYHVEKGWPVPCLFASTEY